MKQIRRHVTYANVMSSLAVFMVLGGATAFAATKIGANQLKANSVKTGKLVKEAVTAGKIKKGAVIESRIADGAVTTNKVAELAVTTGKIADGAVTTGKIANDAVNGEKVNEATLSEVPKANIASTATTANTANAVATSAQGVALAGANINANGTVNTWFNRLGGKPTVSTTATGLYDITFPGLSVATDGLGVVQQATLRTTSFGGQIRVSGLSGAARIRTADGAGAAENSAFNYIVFGGLPG